MNKRPNAFQKSIHHILMLKWVSALLAVFLHHLDAIASKLSRGRHSVTEIVGLPVILLTTIGAKSCQPRTMPLVGLFDGEKIALIGSNFGRKTNPGWYYNLKANPACTAQVGDRTAEYVARQVDDQEREKYWQMAVSYYAGYEKYRQRTAPRPIPVMLLEPVE
ncbi:MAG: nitroreductase family deazaflavin-dependent oxidoreductase [Anaerolineales bacterium]|nr:nitroreductase family deazaflavin-dependent oxidoreductase [Anaerolineales bacterium]